MTTKTHATVLKAVTQRVVDTFTAQGSLFTALDVSNAVKATLPDIRHREVAPLVRDLYARKAMGDYNQTLIDVMAQGRKAAEAYLYHLPEHSPELYDDAMRSQLAIPPVNASTTDDDHAVTASAVEIPVAVGRDGRGRIARQFLHNAGIVGEDVLARPEPRGPKVVLSSVDPSALDDDGVTEALVYEHPSLLHIPRSLMAVFPQGAKLVARVVGASVEIMTKH